MSTYRDGLGRNVPRRIPRERHLRAIFASPSITPDEISELEEAAGFDQQADDPEPPFERDESEYDFGGAFDGFTVTSDADPGL